MIIAVYAVLEVFLMLAARRPRAYGPIVWFAAWSSVLHGAVMAVQAFVDHAERGHFVGDIPAILAVAIVLGWLMPREAEFERNAKGWTANAPAPPDRACRPRVRYALAAGMHAADPTPPSAPSAADGAGTPPG